MDAKDYNPALMEGAQIKGESIATDTLEAADIAAGAVGTSELADSAITDAKINSSATVIKGLASGYKIARGSTSVTGTADITTGLATVVQAVVSLQDDVSLDAIATSVVNGGTAGHITAKVWKPTSSSDCTPIAATVAKTVRWIAIGT